MRVAEDLNYGRGESRLKKWEAKLPEAGASLGIRVRERKDTITPLIWSPSWQVSEGRCSCNRWRMEEEEELMQNGEDESSSVSEDL